MNVDVIIIGSGPAGCTAAITCKQQGLQVLLVAGIKNNTETTESLLRPSESIHPGVLSILTKLNAAHCIATAATGIYEGIQVNDELSPLGEDETGPWHGHHINRTKFDAAFLQTVKDKQITEIEEDVEEVSTTNERVTGIKTSSGKTYNSKYIIDASGQKHIGGRQLKFKASFYSPPLVVWTGVCTDMPSDSPLFEKNYTRFIPHNKGWTWLAPEPPHHCTWTKLELKGRQEFLPPAELAGCTSTQKIIKNNRRWQVYRPVCKEGILLCGDAAGIIDPAAGQGILNAILSATMAAKTVKQCISNVDFEALHLANYDEWFINNYMDKVNRLKHFYSLHSINIFESKAE